MKIDVTPHTTLIEKIGHASFSIWQSISELIANSLDAMPPEKKCVIEIEADSEHIVVKDNGMGMSQEVLEKAVRMAWPMQEVQPYGKKRKRVFGLGLKTACASLGKWWSITTLPEDSDVGFCVVFDFESLIESGAWEAELSELNASEIDLPEGETSGTIVEIKNLKVRPVPQNLKKEISRAYAPHIRNGDMFYLNSDPLLEEKPDLIEGTRVDVDKEIEGVRIHGWGALMVKGSLTNYGFNWYRQGQLIESYDKSFIPNHPSYRQIIGELFADEMPVNFTKKGFEKETPQWREAVRELPEVFEKLLKDARKTKKERKMDHWDKKKLEKTENNMNRIAGDVAKIIEHDGDISKVFDKSIVENYVVDCESDEKVDSLAQRNPIKLGEAKIRWRHRFVSLGEDGGLLDYALEGENELLIATNIDSPFSQIIEDSEVLAIINVAEAVSRFLFENLSYDYEKAIAFRDAWLAHTGALLVEKI